MLVWCGNRDGFRKRDKKVSIRMVWEEGNKDVDEDWVGC